MSCSNKESCVEIQRNAFLTAEVPINSGNISDTKESDLDAAAEYTESDSDSENESTPPEYSENDTQEESSQLNEDQPEDLSLVRHSSCFTSVEDHSLVQDSKKTAPYRNSTSQGPIVLLGRSNYFVSLYKQVFTLTAIAERLNYNLSFIKAEVHAIRRWDILKKNQLEYMKTELEILLGDQNVEPDLPSDLTDTDDEESSGKDGNETDGNASSSSSITEVVYDDNACEKYIKPKQLPPISGLLAKPAQRLPKEGSIIQQSKFPCDKSTTGMSGISQSDYSSAAALPQLAHVSSNSRFGSPATFQQRCGFVTTSETIEKLASSSTWKFNPPPSDAPDHHIGSMLIQVPQQNRQIKLDVHKTTVGQEVSVSHYNFLRNFFFICIFHLQFCN